MVEQLPSYKMDTVTGVQILDEALCIWHNVNTLGKSRHQTILPSAMIK